MTDFVVHLSSSGWKSAPSGDGSFSVRGCIYFDNTKTSLDQLATVFDGGSETDFPSTLQKANGFYALVKQDGKRLIAVVDHIRSIPLFYGQHQGRLYLSDDAEWLRQQMDDQVMDAIASEEFQLAGYVTGRDTLFATVKQLQAGECLVCTSGVNGLSVRPHRYYRFLYTEPRQYDVAELRTQLDTATINSMKRLVDYANGRQIVIPLSGGYDSRLIATCLKNLNYDNILTFTYGLPGNKQAQYSQQVASALGLKWHFVEYSKALWQQAWQTELLKQYQAWASGWCSIAHMQDWLAVKMLKEKGDVESDCIFVPGHGGFLASGKDFSGVPATATDFQHAIFSVHYKLAPLNRVSHRPFSFWAQRIHSVAEADDIIDGESFANSYELWGWQERQAKFIGNSIRAYEFFGYDWWLPLWDKEFVQFWEGVSLGVRKERKLYIGYVKDIYADSNSAADKSGSLGNASEIAIINLLVRLKLNQLKPVWNVLHLMRSKLVAHSASPLAVEGRYPADEYKRLINEGYKKTGIAAYFFLKSCQNFQESPECSAARFTDEP